MCRFRPLVGDLDLVSITECEEIFEARYLPTFPLVIAVQSSNMHFYCEAVDAGAQLW